nr:hypothetical protein [Tanacetum cinerariifolium]
MLFDSRWTTRSISLIWSLSRTCCISVPRLPGQSFVEPPFEQEILSFIHFLRYSGAIRRLTDVNTNKLHQPWRSFAASINKCLTRKSSDYDTLQWNTKIQRRAMRCIILDSRRLSSTTSCQRILRFRGETRNSNAYKEYYAVATGATPPKPKASVRKTRSSSDTTIIPPTAAVGPRLTTSEKGKQAAKASKANSLSSLSEVAMTEAHQLKLATKRSLQQTNISQASGSSADEGTGTIPGVPDVPTDESEEDISWKSTDDEGDDDEDDDGEEGNDDNNDQEDEGDGDEDDEEKGIDDEQAFNEEEFIHPSLSTHTEEEPRDEESFDPIPKTPEDTNDEGNGEENLGLNVGRKEGHGEEEEEDELYRDVNINQGRVIQTTQEFEDSHVTLTPVNPDGQQQSSSVLSQFVTMAPLPMTAPTITPSTIATITTTQQAPLPPTTTPSTILQDLPNFGLLFGFDNRLRTLEMNKAVKVAIQIQSDRLHDEAQKENDEFLKTIDENMQKIIKEQAEVLTRSSNSSKTFYVVAVDLSEMELKKILIEKMKGNKSIHKFNKQRNLYKALVEAYESDKIILDTYGETVMLKRRHDDNADKDEEHSAGSGRGSKRRKEGKELESASAPKEKATRNCDWSETLLATHRSIQPWISELVKQSDSRSSFNELMDTPMDFSNFLMNRLKVDTLTPELLDGPTYELMKGSCKSLVELEFFLEEVYKATTDQLDWVNSEGASSRKYTTSVTKTKAANYEHINWESARDIYSKRRIIAVTEIKIVEWHNYKNLDWIMVQRDDDKLYKFKEGDFKRLRIQDIEGMLLLLVQGKLTNLTVEECFAFNVSLRMFARSIVIQRRVDDLQLGVESYQKKLNLTRPDTYRSDLKHKEAYSAYSNLRGFIY